MLQGGNTVKGDMFGPDVPRERLADMIVSGQQPFQLPRIGKQAIWVLRTSLRTV